jgi:hypothetical protein
MEGAGIPAPSAFPLEGDAIEVFLLFLFGLGPLRLGLPLIGPTGRAHALPVDDAAGERLAFGVGLGLDLGDELEALEVGLLELGAWVLEPPLAVANRDEVAELAVLGESPVAVVVLLQLEPVNAYGKWKICLLFW